MKTCGDCAHFERCAKLISAKPTWHECDWVPSRFELNSNWISTEDRLPEKCISVLVVWENTCSEELMDIAWLDRGLWWKNANQCFDRTYEKVNYWLPLPELPSDTAGLVLTKETDADQ
jgi:hypothetical protein